MDIVTLDELTTKLIADALKREDNAELEIIATSLARAVQQKTGRDASGGKQEYTINRPSSSRKELQTSAALITRLEKVLSKI